MPRLCMQCANSPCTAVCPVGATYRTEDGVILVDARRCIGCGYCVVACPYGARYLVPGRRARAQRHAGRRRQVHLVLPPHQPQGQQPACVEVCPVGARKFGDAADPDSEIAHAHRRARTRSRYWPEYGTRARACSTWAP